MLAIRCGLTGKARVQPPVSSSSPVAFRPCSHGLLIRLPFLLDPHCINQVQRATENLSPY